jgi:hypothetical protein
MSDRVQTVPAAEQASTGTNGNEPLEQRLFEDLLQKYRAALLTSEQLETTPITPRAKLLGEWLRECDLGFLYGERGIGKTWLVCAVATHVSTGNNLGTWKSWGAFPVLYVDGEMAQDSTRDRLKGMFEANKNLHVLHHERLFDLSGLSMNLANPLIQKVITNLCIGKEIKVLILDNLSCLVSGVKENDSDAWEQLLFWLLELRRRRIAVIIVHHAGRNGFMRGTSKREDPAAWVIKIESSSKANPTEDGAKFETAHVQTSRQPPWPGEAFDAARFIRICHLVEQGWTITKACESESITYSLFRLRCSENPRLEQRIKEAEAIRFQRRAEEAVASVMAAGEKNWTAHAWFLERALPHLWALKNVNRSEAATDQPIGDRIDENQLRRYSELMEDFKRENQAKSVAQTVSLPAPESAAG